MVLFIRFFLFVLFTVTITLCAQGENQPESFREYRFLFGPANEIETIAEAGTSLNKIFQDIYFRGLQSRVPSSIQPYTEIIWSAFWTYFFTLWPHEYGHRARARQSGGDFIINNKSFPFPSAEMILPPSLDIKMRTLSSIGGLEINNRMMNQIHMDFYENDYAYADEMIHAFIQEVFFPFYSIIVTPADPDKPSTWTSTRGDPVEAILSVYEKHTGRPAIREDGSVDPELSRYYRESVYVNILWTLLDPMLYQSAKAFGADMNKNHGLMRPWMIGKNRLSWAWGTQFHSSPLGYELYFNNYFRVNGNLYSLYFKTGRPYKNIGLGIRIPGLVKKGGFALGAGCDIWDQDLYGKGASFSVDLRYQFYKGVGLLLDGSWKDEGYLVGRRVGKTKMLYAGFSYRF